MNAPGKIILVGEHSVVYGQPGCRIIAPQIDLQTRLHNAGDEHQSGEPLKLVTRLVLQDLQQKKIIATDDPDWQIELDSQIPIASGLGSGAAISTALVKTLYAHAQQPVETETINQIVYQSERLYHGTPSGIDNTVIVYGQPLWFIRHENGPPTTELFQPAQPFTIAIADSGVASPTKEAVGQVRQAWQADPNHYNRLFAEMGELAHAARTAIETGDLSQLGQLFDQNQNYLAELDVSSSELDQLISTARKAGALGAKVSGGGKGGNIIALVTPETQQTVVDSLMAAGAKRVIVTEVHS